MPEPSSLTPSSPGRWLAAAVRRRPVLGLWLLATVLAGVVAALGFRIDNSVGVWFAEDDPALVEYRRFLRDFGDREWLLVVLERGPGRAEALDAERDSLVAAVEGMDHVHAVLSAARLPPESDVVRKILRPAAAGASEALLVQITNDIDSQERYREDLVAGVRGVAESFPTVTRARIAGIAVINGELNRSARRDMFLFFPAVTLFLAALGTLLFRNYRDTVVLLAVSLGSVAVTQGLLIGIGYPLNMITIMLPTVLIALSVADAVHLIHVFHGRHRGTGDSLAAARGAARHIMWPCAGTSLTTIAGFLSFSRSSVLPVFQLAVFASFGIALAWLLTVTVAPVLLAELWRTGERRERPGHAKVDGALRGWSRLVARRPGWIVAAFVVGSVPLMGLRSLEADTNYVEFFRADSRVPRDYVAIQRAGFPQNPLTLILRAPKGTALTAPEYWVPIATLSRRIEGLREVHSVLSPSTLAGAADAGSPSRLDLEEGPSSGPDQMQLVLMTDYTSSTELFSLLARVEALAAEVLPHDVQVVPTGTSVLWAGMDVGVIRTQKESLLIVSLVCLGLLLLLFQSAPLAALGLALGLYPVGVVLGLMGLLGISVNMATVLIAGIAVGLAVDNTIHFVHEYQAGQRRGKDRASALEGTMRTVGLRMVVTSAILVGAFAVMGVSDFVPTAQFGLLSSLTIVLALVTDLALLPVALRWAPVSTAVAALPVVPGVTPGAMVHPGEDPHV